MRYILKGIPSVLGVLNRGHIISDVALSEKERGPVVGVAVELSSENFESTITGNDLVLVDFWASWCGPCKMIAPALEEISEELADQVEIAKVDIMENTEIASQFGVQSIPLMILFKDGEIVETKVGAAPKAAIKSWLEAAL